MLKWCPKPFEAGTVISQHGGNQAVDNPRFEKDPCLTDGNSVMDLMNQVDKDRLMDSARDMLVSEFENREKELLENHRTEIAQVRDEFNARLENWSRELAQGQILGRQEIAVEAAGLALAMARKIIRDTVMVDPEFVTRTLETILFKVRNSNRMDVTLHPDDATLLENNPELRARLRIGTVTPDRRVEKGGCLVKAGTREWDATLSRQMDSLSWIVEETLASGGSLLTSKPGE
jgi:hypothetical protein